MGRIVWTMVSICLVTILLWMMATPGAAPGGPPVLGAPQVPVPRQVPVLLYHDLIPGYHGRNGAVIAVEAFEAQMAWLRENGYTPVTSVELARWVRGEGKLPARPVAIQFDDGYRSNYEHAFPIIARHGMKATIFLVTSSIGHDYLLTPEQIREMAASGLIKFQGHTHRGHETADAQPELRTWTESQVRADHRQMQAEFAAAGLAAPATFAYPFGVHNEVIIAGLRAEGVAAAFTVEHGYVRPGDDPMRLRRLIVGPGTSLCRFAELVTEAEHCP